jgi:hypothetical protein
VPYDGAREEEEWAEMDRRKTWAADLISTF